MDYFGVQMEEKLDRGQLKLTSLGLLRPVFLGIEDNVD